MREVDWIDVKDRMPESYRNVLIYDAVSCLYNVAWWDPRLGPDGQWFDGDGASRATHWCELPRAPKVT